MKKLLVMLLTAVLALGSVFTVTGCRDKTDPLDDPNKVNLSFWCPNILADFFNDFEVMFEDANKDINVKIIFKPETDLYGAMDSTLGTKEAPDMFVTLGGMIVPTLYKSGHLMDIDSIVTAVEDKLIDNAKINKKDAGGKYHSLPLTGMASPVVFYNVDEFENMKNSSALTEAQKSAVKEPETYDEFIALCDAIHAYGKETMTGAFSSWHMPHLMQALHSRTMTKEAYASLLNTDGDNPFRANLQAYAAGFDLLKQYRDDGVFEKNFEGRSLTDADLQFKTGKALMRMGISTDFNDLKGQMPFTVKAFYLPPSETVSDTPRANVVFSDVVCANKNTEHPDEVKKVLEALLSAEAQSILAEHSMLPTRKDADASEMPATIKALYDEIVENGANDFYQSWSFTGIDIEVLMGAQSVLAGSMTSLQAAESVANFFDNNKRD